MLTAVLITGLLSVSPPAHADETIGERVIVPEGYVELSIPEDWLFEEDHTLGQRRWRWITDSSVSESHVPNTGADAIIGVSIKQVEPATDTEDRRTVGQIEVARLAAEAREKGGSLQGRICGEEKIGKLKCEKICFTVPGRSRDSFVAREGSHIHTVWYDYRTTLAETYQELVETLVKGVRFLEPTADVKLEKRRLFGERLELELPRNWSADSLDGGSAARIVYTPPGTEAPSAAITLMHFDELVPVQDTTITEPVDLARYWMDVVVSEHGGAPFTLFRNEEIEVNDFAGLHFEWTTENIVDHRLYHVYHVALVNGRELFAVNLETEDVDFELYRPAFDRVIKSLKPR